MMTEMKGISYILQNITPKRYMTVIWRGNVIGVVKQAFSVVLIDELCRSTEIYDGIGLCWSICEYLMEINTTTFFTTHMHELCLLGATTKSFFLFCQSLLDFFRQISNCEVVNHEGGCEAKWRYCSVLWGERRFMLFLLSIGLFTL